MEANKVAKIPDGHYQGMNWIRPERRLAIYLRDGLACCYCGAGLEMEGTILTLDHLRAQSHNGSNLNTNLVTACHRCNSSRGNRSWKKFAEKVAAYINHGATSESITAHISKTRKKTVDVAYAKTLILARGGFTLALKGTK